MNEELPNQVEAVSSDHEEIEIPEQESGTETFAETFDQIEEIEVGKDEQIPSADSAAETADRLHATSEQLDAAKTEVNYAERSGVLEGKKQSMREKFDAGVRRAILPVAAAFALGGSPAEALGVPTMEEVDHPEMSSVIPDKTGEKKELTREKVFETNSSLSQSSEKFKEQPASPEELTLLKDLQGMAWTEKNEWMAYTRRDKEGNLKTTIKESGPTGGLSEIENLDEEKEKKVSHTHPVEMSGSAPSIRKEVMMPFVMPPSAADFGTCMDTSEIVAVQRVVDPRGVWEYQCDGESPLAQMKKKAGEQIASDFDKMKADYNITDEDLKKSLAKASNDHPSLMFAAIFKDLDAKYPGVKKRGDDIFLQMGMTNAKFGRTMFEYEMAASSLYESSSSLSDEKLGTLIKSFIGKAEGLGMNMRYTPFRELPEKKNK